jgi:hypothetical protein
MRSLLRRPFAFWLPAFVSGSLLWAWVDSCYHVSSIRVEFPGSALELGHSWSNLSFTYYESGMRGGGPRRISTGREELPPDQMHWWFPLPAWQLKKGGGFGARMRDYYMVLPHWVIVLAWGGAWWAGAWFVGRERKAEVIPLR